MSGRLVNGFTPADDPLSLSSATIYVPNRRAGRALSTAFLAHFDGQATLLPQIRTLGDTSDDEFGLDVIGEEIHDHAAAFSELDRKLELASLIRMWKSNIAEETRRLYGDEDIIIPTSSADSLYLAGDLSALLTQLTQEEADWGDVTKIVPDEYAQWWQLTTVFLRIVMEFWPSHLEELGYSDPVQNAVNLLNLRAKRIEVHGSDGPIIVAGTTGSVPSTQSLLKAVSNLPNGAIVLPGLDFSISDDEWQKLEQTDLSLNPLIEAQPQFGLARTLSALGYYRENVIELGLSDDSVQERNRLVSMSLSLSEFTADWLAEAQTFDLEKLKGTFARVSFIEASNERQEALAIAVALREVLEDETKTAALVTPDRDLARRVSMELERFGILVDDTGGSALSATPAAIFVRQIANICFGDASNPDLASFLKSEMCCVGMMHSEAEQQARLFELVALRGTLTSPSIGAFKEALEHRRAQLETSSHVAPRIAALTNEGWAELLGWSEKLDAAFQPYFQFLETVDSPALEDFAEVLRKLISTFSISSEGEVLLASAYGAAEIDMLLEDMMSGTASGFGVSLSEFPSVLDALLSDLVCRAARATHPRLHIYGPLEVRLLDHDRVILGGLNEDSWPQNNRIDAFLNRTMRRELGLPTPERRTGLAAHDFQQLMGKSEVILSRSGRLDKSPTVASRWLQRLFALLGEEVSSEVKKRGQRYLDFAALLDAADQRPARSERPNPKPPVDVRPNFLPVTDIETWIRDPYALYAKRILKLRQIDPLERDPDPMLRGTLYHAIMQEYVEGEYSSLPLNKRLQKLDEIAERHIENEKLAADVALIWNLRFKEVSKLFVEWETRHFEANDVKDVRTEIDGTLRLGSHFTLSARADRIEMLADGRVNIQDYKTGGNPTAIQARSLSPQIALEGAIAQAGGFEKTETAEVANMQFIRLRRAKSLKVDKVSTKDNSDSDIIENARENLLQLIEAYQSQDMGYLSRRAPFKDSEMSGDYDHLARTREWSFGVDEVSDE